MRTIQLYIPESVNLKDYDLSMIIAAKLCEDAIFSSGQAVQMVGLSMCGFIDIIGKYDVSIFSTSVFDLHAGIENV